MSGVRQTPQLYSEASTFSHPELSEAARVLSNMSWAKTTDRSARTAPARAARQQRFYDLVDPDRTLDLAERERRASVVRTAHYRAMATKAHAARRANRGAAA